MKTAVIADIHGNFYALEAVLNELKKELPDQIICAGDLVNPLWDSKLVWEVLQSEKITCLRGNHEDYLISYQQNPSVFQNYHLRPIKYTAEKLGKEFAARLAELPLYCVAGEKEEILICHTSPGHNARNYTGKSAREILADYAGFNQPLIVNAHLHQPDLKAAAGRQIVTTGSVGLPMSRKLKADYLLITSQNGSHHIEHRLVEYPHDKAVNSFVKNGFLEDGGAIAWLLLDELLTADKNLAHFIPQVLSQPQPPETETEWIEAVMDFLKRNNRWQEIKKYL